MFESQTIKIKNTIRIRDDVILFACIKTITRKNDLAEFVQ